MHVRFCARICVFVKIYMCVCVHATFVYVVRAYAISILRVHVCD